MGFSIGNYKCVILDCSEAQIESASLEIPGLPDQATVSDSEGVKSRLALVHKDELDYLDDPDSPMAIPAYLVDFGMIRVLAPAQWFRKTEDTDLAKMTWLNLVKKRYPDLTDQLKEEPSEAEEEEESRAE